MPTAAQFENASRTIGSVRKLTSPVFLSTDTRGRRIPDHLADDADG